MKNTAIIVTSTSGADYVIESNNVHVARLTVSFSGKEYIDYKEIKAEDFYQMMLENPNADIHTSQVSTGSFVQLYEDLKSKGYNNILVISISSKLSGTYNGAVLAKELVNDLNIEVIDSKSVSYGEYYLVKRAQELLEQNYDFNELVKILEKDRSNVKIYVLVDTLKYLVKNGRLSATAGLLGTLLKIKPLLKIMEDGSLKPFEKIRTTTKAQKRALELVLEETKDLNCEYFVAYTTNKEKAEEIKNELLELRSDAKVVLIPLTPVVGAHAGPGTLGLGYSLI